MISLVENHRQENDREFADMLNRIRVGSHNEEDLNTLQSRVRPEGHNNLKGALVIASTNDIVNKHNDQRLAEFNSKLIIIEAINSHQNIPNYQPKIHPKKKTVAETPYLQRLCLKKNARVMSTFVLMYFLYFCNLFGLSIRTCMQNLESVAQKMTEL